MPRLLQYLGPQHIADSQELGEMVGNETEQGWKGTLQVSRQEWSFFMVISIGQIIGNFKNFRQLSNFRGNLGIFDSETEKKTIGDYGETWIVDCTQWDKTERATHPPSHTHTHSTPPNSAGTMLSNILLHRIVLEQASYSGKGHFLLIVIYPGPTSQFEQCLTHL